MTQRHHHDSTTGLCWKETIITTNTNTNNIITTTSNKNNPRHSSSTSSSKQMQDFLNRSIGSPPPRLLKSKQHDNGGGGGGDDDDDEIRRVESLETMALRCLLGNLDALVEESLEGVCGMMVKRIWGEIVRNNLQNLRLWQLFTTICPDDPPSPTHSTITRHHIPLSLVIPAIESPSFAYLTCLTLVDQIADSSISLLLLSTLSNLASLHIVGSSTSSVQTSMIDDSTLRMWSKRAIHQDGFPRLKMLFLRFQFGVTEMGLAELGGFKVLEMCVTSRCGVKVKEAKKVVKRVGWKMTSTAFYTHADAILRDCPLGKNYLDIVASYLTSTIPTPSSSSSSSPASSSSPTTTTPPLSFIQLGRQSPTHNTNILHSINEIDCWIKDDEKTKEKETERKRDVSKKEEDKQETGRKKRRIVKEAKRRDLLGLLEEM